MNSVVERWLADHGVDTQDRWYRGRPVLVRANDYQVGLFNGDLGVCWPQEGRLWAFFPDPATGGVRRLPLARLPAHDTAWAMTVHMSQGSEVDLVLLVLPESDHPLVDRELLYTGATRARERVELVATAEVVTAALRRSNRRRSGLVDALAAEASTPLT